jgi:PKD repeat protein
VFFTNTTTGDPPITYQWNFGDGATSTATDPSHLYAAAGSFNVTLIATNAAGSSSSSTTVTVVP